MRDDHPILAILRDYEATWCRGDLLRLKDWWDTDDPNVLYIAEEAEPLVGWPAIDEYLGHTGGLLKAITIRISNVQIVEASPDIARAFYRMHWNAKFGDSAPIGDDNRVVALFRRKPEGWRMFTYIEAPWAALTQLRRAKQRLVDPEFLAALGESRG